MCCILFIVIFFIYAATTRFYTYCLTLSLHDALPISMDPGLQLWVAACLYKGVEDIQAVLGIEHDDDTAERLYRYCARLGTTLQVRPSQWPPTRARSEEQTSELQSLMRISYAVFCLKKKKKQN